MSNLWKIIRGIFQALWVPLVVYVACVAFIALVSDQRYAMKQWQENADPKDRKPLYIRVEGYDADALARHWDALDERAQHSQQLFLQMDLFFPFFYGGSLAYTLWQVRTTSGKRFSLVFPFASLLVAMIADWTENLTQLSQLRLFMEGGQAALQPGWIQIASVATMLKIVFFSCAVISLAALAGKKSLQQNQQ